MFLPRPLLRGSRAALVAPSGTVPADRLQAAVSAVAALGLAPVVYESCRASHGYLAGSDGLRAEDIDRAFADPSVDGVLCIRGGYGAQRLLDRIDFDLIAAHPKFFCGYSDVTALHIALNQRCGFVTFHTPMPATELCCGADDYTLRSYRRALSGEFYGELKNPPGMPLCALVPGGARGRLVGGNLSLVSSSLGTPYEIDTRGKILFLEDVGEEPYRVDRMLTQLKLAGKLRESAGILLGSWTDCGAKEPERSLTLPQVFEEVVVPQGRPTLAGLACGHSLPSMSLPMGAVVEMDACAGRIAVLPG